MSACLAGKKCRWDGTDRKIAEIEQLVREGKAIPVCPETSGGLGVPRQPSEQRDGGVYFKDGTDVTDAFTAGAEKCLAEGEGCRCAVLKEKSPSCGVHLVYDGSFSGKLKQGCGIFTCLLQKQGIVCMNEEEYLGRKHV